MDFYQDIITTVHRLSEEMDRVVVSGVESSRGERPAAVVVPILYDELSRPAIGEIAEGLAKATYLNEVIVALTASDASERDRTVEFFRKRGLDATVLWCEDPRIREAFARLQSSGLDVSRYSGKGMAVWTAFGLAADGNYAVALHDGDIEGYFPTLPARLLYPLVDPALDFFFSKGFYSRVSLDRMYGRVVRLYVWPFLDAWLASHPLRSPFARYLRSFRYPLAGEMALTTDLAMNLRVPTDWGLEMGVLGEVYRNATSKRICQVDLGVYSHKHQEIGASSSEGLLRMVHDITATFFRVATETEATVITPEGITALRVVYRRMAQDAIRKYAVDAAANGFTYLRHEEEAAVEAFAGTIEEAGRTYLASAGAEAQIPDWLRVRSVDEHLSETLRRTATPTARDRDVVRDTAHEASRKTRSSR